MCNMKATLLEMLRQIRGFTRQMLDSTNAQWLTWAPDGTSNHMLWHAGHAIWVQDRLCVQRLTGESELEPSWGKMFGMDCEPVRSRTEWPPVTTMTQMLAAQEDRLRTLIEHMSDEQLVINVDDNRDLVGGIIHGLHDEAKHHGEMYLLHKICVANQNEEKIE